VTRHILPDRYGLNPQADPMPLIDAPKVARQMLPGLSLEQVQYLIDVTDNLPREGITSLFADSGMRLGGLANIKACNIDWKNYAVTIWGKGDNQRKATFTERSAQLLRGVVFYNGAGESTCHMKPGGYRGSPAFGFVAYAI